jgi:hypothetical protein
MESMPSPPPSSGPHQPKMSDALLSMVFRSIGVLAVLAVPFVSGLGAVDGTPLGEQGTKEPVPVWQASYSERYPGCVASVLWPAAEQPVAVVVRAPDGAVEKVALDPRRQSLQELAPGTTAIGACR